MSESAYQKQRRFERLSLPEGKRLICQATGDGLALDGEVSVLGLGGMYIRAAAAQPVGSRVAIRMRNIADVVEAECVVRDSRPEGFGVEFLDLRPKFRRNLERILARLKEPPPTA
jgi:hypothetical protein